MYYKAEIYISREDLTAEGFPKEGTWQDLGRAATYTKPTIQELMAELYSIYQLENVGVFENRIETNYEQNDMFNSMKYLEHLTVYFISVVESDVDEKVLTELINK